MVGNEEEEEGVDCRGAEPTARVGGGAVRRHPGGESHARGKEGEGTPPPGGKEGRGRQCVNGNRRNERTPWATMVGGLTGEEDLEGAEKKNVY
jgi:hypothetical protein